MALKYSVILTEIGSATEEQTAITISQSTSYGAHSRRWISVVNTSTPNGTYKRPSPWAPTLPQQVA